MEQNLFLFLPNSSSIAPSLVIPAVRTHSCFSTKITEKTQFLGKGLIFSEKRTANLGFSLAAKKTYDVPFYHPVVVRAAAAVKRRKELPFDNVIQRDKKLKLVVKIRKILVSQPDWTMSLKDLGRYRTDLGLTNKRGRLIALLNNFPAVFQIEEQGVFSLKFRLTPEAERLYEEELKVRNEMEDLLVTKVRKLLMMSLDKRILLEKIVHLRTDLGLPSEFRDTICHRYPHYFRVVATGRGPALELTHWDPKFAVSAAELAHQEKNQAVEQLLEEIITDNNNRRRRPPPLPKGLNLSRSEMRTVCKFRDLPYVSPYSDFSSLRSGSVEKEKHACGVVHELLSLTIEKRTLVDHLTHFREEFRFSQQVRGMLIRHPDMFYVSLKGDRDSVFLREGYRDSQLTETDRLLIIKEKLRSLVAVMRRRGTPKSDDNDNDNDDASEEDAGEERWDIDGFLSNGEVDDSDSDNDDWTREDDNDMPPDFDEDDDEKSADHVELDGNIISSRKGEEEEEEEEEVIVPDGQPSPRERW